MQALESHPVGRHFLQIPGPSPVPERVLRAISYPTMDHRSPEFGALGLEVLDGIRTIFQTTQPVIIYPGSGTGAWEAALVNTLSPGDHVLMYETGHFATLWKQLAERLGLATAFISAPEKDAWRHAVDANVIEDRLRRDTAHTIRAVCVVHNETSTGVVSDIHAVRRAIDAAGHPALLLVDTISGLGSADYRHDAWGVDVTVSGSQKGLMLPPGLGFNAVSARALEASQRAGLKRAYWAWDDILTANRQGFWPTTPATNLLYGLRESLALLQGEGLEQVFARHQRLAAACRVAVQAWGLETQCQQADAHSPVLTGVVLPEGVDADALRALILKRFNMSLGTGLGRLRGRMFRIGHLGECNELTLMGALAGCEMGLRAAGVPLQASGLAAAATHLASNNFSASR